jgi:hypothetical protein
MTKTSPSCKGEEELEEEEGEEESWRGKITEEEVISICLIIF